MKCIKKGIDVKAFQNNLLNKVLYSSNILQNDDNSISIVLKDGKKHDN